jgi:exosortase
MGVPQNTVLETKGGWSLPLFLAVLWGQLFFALSPTWLEIPSYQYALVAAPLLSLLLFQAWKEAITTKDLPPPSSRNPVLAAGLFLIVIPLLVLRPLQQVDQFWRLPLWLHALAVLSTTFLTLGWAMGWRRSRHLLRLSLFLVLLVPLPSALESMITGNLTRLVSGSVGGLLPWMGYPIDRLGNAMLVKGTILDVAEGCSGLRSFQAAFMAGVILGEFYQHTLIRRILLLATAIGLAMLGNGARIYYLTTVAYNQGPEAEARVHGTAGMIVTTLIFTFIGLVAWWLSRRETFVKKRTVRREATL